MSKVTTNRGRRVNRKRWMLNTTVSPYLISEIDEICSKKNLTRSWIVERALIIALPTIKRELGLDREESEDERKEQHSEASLEERFMKRLLFDLDYRAWEWEEV